MEPHVDTPAYVGFSVKGQEIGLVPRSSLAAMIAYCHVDNIQQSLQVFLEAGGQTLDEVREVGGGRQVAAAKDADGNIIGFIQDS